MTSKTLKTQPFTEEELKRAKDQVLNSFIFSYDSVDKVLNEQAKLEFYGYPLDYLEKYRAAVEKVTTADLDRVAKKYIDPSKLAILVVGNSSEFGTPLSTLGQCSPSISPFLCRPEWLAQAQATVRINNWSNQMRMAIAIMAAGKGTRLKSKRPKVLHEIGGKPLLAHVITAASKIVAPADIYVIVGHEADRVKAAVAATGVQFVLQPKQRGTGHAIQCAREQVKDYETLLVLSGDAPLIRPETICPNARLPLPTTRRYDHPYSGAGRSLRIWPRPTRQRQTLPKSQQSSSKNRSLPEQTKAPEINSGIYAFATAPLFEHIDSLATNNAHGELYLTDMAGLLVSAGTTRRRHQVGRSNRSPRRQHHRRNDGSRRRHARR